MRARNNKGVKAIRKYYQLAMARWKVALLLLILLAAAGFGLFRAYQFLTFRPPGIVGSIKLAVPSKALPQGIAKNEISATVLNIFELPENVKQEAGEDIIMAAIKLEPSNIQFSEPVSFTMTVFANHEFTPQLWHTGNLGTEEIKDLQISFNKTKQELTITGSVNHFSEISATKKETQETAKEFVARRQEEADWLLQQANQETFYSEKARKFHELAQKGFQWEEEGVERFGDDSDLPQLGKNAYHKSAALEQYGINLEEDYLGQIELTKDPNKKFDLLKEWVDKTDALQTEWGGAAWDSQFEYPVLGQDSMLNRALGESTRGFEIPIEKGTSRMPGIDVLLKLAKEARGIDSIIDIEPFDDGTVLVIGRPRGSGIAKQIFAELDERIRKEADPLKRFDLLKDRLDKTDWVLKQNASAGMDERIALPLAKDALKESTIFKEQSESIINNLLDLVGKEQNLGKKQELAQKLLDIVNWLRERVETLGYDEWRAGNLDMSHWPDSIEDILGDAVPAGPEIPKTKPKPTTAPKSSCNIPAFQECANTFSLQGCIDACPYVSATCPPGTPPNTDCKITDKACSDTCWNNADAHIDSCLASNNCTKEEVIAGGGGAQR